MSLRLPLCCWILSVLLGGPCLSTVLAQDTTNTSNTSTTATITPTPSTLPTPSTSTPTLPTPSTSTPSLPASDLTACSTPVPQLCTPSPTTLVTGIIVLVALLVISLVSCTVLLLVVCLICCRRKTRETEIKKYVFEEGVQPPELWVDPEEMQEKTNESTNVWEEATTFTPSPHSKNTSMPFPDAVNGNGNIQSVCDNGNGILHSNGKETIQPVPVAPVKVKKISRFRPKRIAPPPPKMSKRKKLRRNKCEDDSVVYAVPSPFCKPVGGAKNGGYDVPRKSKWRIPHIYKAIDVSKVNQPSPYADLVVKQ